MEGMGIEKQQLLDGLYIKLHNDQKIELTNVKKITIKLLPYLVFHVNKYNGSERERTPMKIVMPFTGEKKPDKQALICGEIRNTHSIHYIDTVSKSVKRKLDLLMPHKVEVTGHRHLFIEMNNGENIEVGFDGNCINLIDGIEQLQIGDHFEEPVEYFDRASEILNVAKKQHIKIMSYI